MNSKIALKDKLAYGVGAFGDTISYNLITVYLLYFLTDVAFIPTIEAGTIILVASMTNSVMIVIAGYVSDHARQTTGRRSKMMGLSVPITFVASLLLFNVVDFNLTARIIYYCSVTILLWFSHTLFVIPYNAAAADISANNKERTTLRGFARFYMSIGNLIGLVLFTELIAVLGNAGCSLQKTWLISITIISCFTTLSLFITCKYVRNKEDLNNDSFIIKNKKKKTGIGDLLKKYIHVFKYKEIRYILTVVFFFSGGNTFFYSLLLYYMKYNLSLDESYKSLVFLVISILGMLLTPLLSKLAFSKGNKWTMMLSFLIASVGMIAIICLRLQSLLYLCVIVIFFTIASSAYWQFINTFTYEVGDFEDKKENANDGTLTSLIVVSLRFFSAIFSQILTVFLAFCGYNSELSIQSDSAANGIEIGFIAIPAAFFLLVSITLYRYHKFSHHRQKNNN